MDHPNKYNKYFNATSQLKKRTSMEVTGNHSRPKQLNILNFKLINLEKWATLT